MTFTESLPTLNACLNGTATILLTIGFICIKTGREKAHRTCMVSAFSVSVIFLFFYVLHKWLVKGVHTPFQGEGPWVAFYYIMLATHIVLAIVIVPLILTTLTKAVRGKRESHRAWARWTFPFWYYVSVTGVLIYLFLYVFW